MVSVSQFSVTIINTQDNELLKRKMFVLFHSFGRPILTCWLIGFGLVMR